MLGIFKPARLSILLLVALATVSCILSALALFAGHENGFMEKYDIVRINMTGFGQDLLELATGDGGSDDGDGNILEQAWDTVSDGIKDKINDLAGDVVDEVAERLGISEWYSLHVMTVCEGSFTPNASASSPGLNSTECHDTAPNKRFNITDLLNEELNLGPLNINIADINWPSEIQDKLDLVNDLLLALFILCVIAVGLNGLNALLGVVSWLAPDSRLLLLANVCLSGLGMLATVLAAVLVTVAVAKGLDEFNDVADQVGIKGHRGGRFLTFAWIAAGFMIIASVGWLAQLCVTHRRRGRHTPHRKGSY